MSNKKSSGSSRGRYNARHEVQVAIQIEQAVPPPDRFPHLKESLREQQPKVIYENPLAQHHFHLEYQLLPGVEQTSFKTDVVVYGGVVAKVFTDSDARVVRTWEENGKMWYGWTHKHTFSVTKETLLDIYRHKINFRVWNNKDHFCAKAKFDRPKAFRLPNEDRYTSLSDRAAGSVGDLQCPEGGTSGSMRPRKLSSVLHSVLPKGKGKVAGKTRQKPNQSSESEGEGEYASVDLGVPDTLDEEDGKEEAEGTATDTAENKVAAGLPELPPPTRAEGLASSRRKMTKADQQALFEADQIRQFGLLGLSLSWSDAFGKRPSASIRSREGRRELQGMVVTMELLTTLMPEEWRRELCPMAITLCSAYNMPSSPVSFEELRHRCKPAYAQFKFIDQSVLQTCGQPQGDTICWNQAHVFLLGTVDPGILLEHLRGPLLVEVHDRDCSDAVSQPSPSLFGDDEKDSILGTAAFTAGHVLQRNPFAGPQKPFSPFGLVRVDLSSLLSGQTYLEVTAPIQRGPRRSSQNQTISSGSVPAGDYLGSGAVLKVRVELMYPVVAEDSSLVVGTRATQRATSLSCPFIRSAYILSAGTGHTVLRRLLDTVAHINSDTLSLDDLPQDIRAAALSTYKLTKSEMADPTLNAITGFHVSDGEIHIVVLEGLGDQGMQTLWEEIPHHSLQDDGVITVLWNSSYQFSERLYGLLDVDIPCIRLHQPLHLLTRQSAVYIMDNVPEESFKALMCLNELSRASKLSDVVRCSLLPSADMVLSLSMEFGVPASFEDLALVKGSNEGLSLSEEEREKSGRTLSVKRRRRRRCASLDNHNPWYEGVLEERRGLTAKNFIQANMQCTRSIRQSAETQRPHSVAGETRGRHFLEEVSPPPPPLEGPSPSSSTPVFNYSSQKLNSTELAKERLRERLKQDGSHRYTYSQQYQSMTIVPVNVEKVVTQQQESRREKWRTPEGFRYPGVPPSRQANTHPKKPPASRIADLNEPFTDNELHWNTTKPSVERVELSWSERGQDFERYTKPPVDFGVTQPATIHHAGDSRKKELNEFLTEEQLKWEDRLVVDDARFHTLRKGSQTEQTTKGRKASSQLDKLQGLLKDAPQKHSFKVHSGSADTPPLSTLHSFGLSGKKDSNIAGDELVGYHPAGLFKGSLKVDRNVVPIANTN